MRRVIAGPSSHRSAHTLKRHSASPCSWT